MRRDCFGGRDVKVTQMRFNLGLANKSVAFGGGLVLPRLTCLGVHIMHPAITNHWGDCNLYISTN
jgi:hypothetical protein